MAASQNPPSGPGLTAVSALVAVGAGPAILDLLGLAAFLAELSSWPVVVPWCLAALALVAMLGLRARAGRSRVRGIRPVGDDVTVRLLLIAVAGVAVVQRSGAPALLVALGVLGLLTVADPVVGRLDRLARPFAARMPGAPTRRPGRVGSSAVLAVDTVALVVLLISSYLGPLGAAPVVWVSALAVLAVCVMLSAITGLSAFRRIVDRRRFESEVARLLADRVRPRFALHWEAPGGTGYQVAMWLPYLERLGVPYVILVRTETNFRDVLALGDVSSAPVLLRKNIRDLDTVIVPSLRTVFYVNTSTKNEHTVRYAHLTHVQLNHGDSDKAPSYSPVFRMFDKDFVAGQAAVDRFAAHGVNMPEGIFSIVGRPQVESVRVSAGPIGVVAHPTVLYAPTWAGFHADSNYSSLAHGYEIVESVLRRGCSVVFRPHPYARRTPLFARECERIIARLAADRPAGAAHVFGPEAEQQLSVFDCFNRSDAMITDVSSVVVDYLFSEKPFAMVAITTGPDDFVAEFPVAAGAYLVDGRLGHPVGMDESLDAMLGDDPMVTTRRRLRAYYLGDFPAERYAERFLTEARRYL